MLQVKGLQLSAQECALPSLDLYFIDVLSVLLHSLELRSRSLTTCVLCLLWADSTALQYLVTGLVHQLGSYWMHRAIRIDLDVEEAVHRLFA